MPLNNGTSRKQAALENGTGDSLVSIIEYDKDSENRLIRNIHPDDKMYLGNDRHYFSVMRSALRMISIGLYSANRDKVEAIMDFGCGFGRVQRGLRAIFPDARIVAADINRAGVDFCGENFGAECWYQESWPPAFAEGVTFDLIWAGSVMTHLPAERTMVAMNMLLDRLTPGGVLVSTFHGRYSIYRQKFNRKYVSEEQFMNIENGYDKKGYGFTGTFDKHYGFSVCRPSWVFDFVGHRQDIRVVSYIEKGWDNHQDVLACLKENIA